MVDVVWERSISQIQVSGAGSLASDREAHEGRPMLRLLQRPALFVVLLLATACGLRAGEEQGKLSQSYATSDLSADEVVSREENASRSVASVVVVEDEHSDLAISISVSHIERVYDGSDYYGKTVGAESVEQILFYRGQWFQRDLSGKWTREEELDTAARHAFITFSRDDSGTPLGTRVLLPRVIAANDVQIRGSGISRLDDEVIDGQLFFRLRSTFVGGQGTLIQDYWINAQTFLVHRIKFSGTFQRSEEHTSELQSRGHLVCR